MDHVAPHPAVTPVHFICSTDTRRHPQCHPGQPHTCQLQLPGKEQTDCSEVEQFQSSQVFQSRLDKALSNPGRTHGKPHFVQEADRTSRGPIQHHPPFQAKKPKEITTPHENPNQDGKCSSVSQKWHPRLLTSLVRKAAISPTEIVNKI